MPVPTKLHYTFNIKDIGKVLHGLFQADPSIYKQRSQFLRLYYHETDRTFSDRLINTTDKEIFKKIIKESCLKFFGEEIVAENEQLLFADFIHSNKPKQPRHFENVRDVESLKKIICDHLGRMNAECGRDDNLILFQEAVEHLIRIARILRLQSENGLILGTNYIIVHKGSKNERELRQLASYF